MRVFRELFAGLRSIVSRKQNDRDPDDEVRHYIEMATQERSRAGMSPDEAERAARLEIGGAEAVKKGVR